MKTVLIKNKILILSVSLVLVTLLSCYKFESIEQPEWADPNSTFEVKIKVHTWDVEQKSQDLDEVPYFGIRLPLGWSVKDSISYSGFLNGTFIYSSRLSDSMEVFNNSPEGYYWWVCVGDTIDIPWAEGVVEFTPQFQTDNQTGTFFIDYMLGDNDIGFPSPAIRCGDLEKYPISVNAPLAASVTNTNDSGEGSLRQAILDIGNGGEIKFELSYPATITLDSMLVVDRSLSIIGPNKDELIISGKNQNQVIFIDHNLMVNISNVIIADGIEYWGGGLGVEHSNLYLQNVLFCNNTSERGGGLISIESNVILINVTIVGSGYISVDQRGGAIHGNFVAVNSILWDNTSEPIYAEGDICIINSDIQYGINGIQPSDYPRWLIDNITTNPIFVDAENGDYRLQESSPCIDAGIQDTMIVYNDGQDTIFIPPMDYIGSAPDMGAYEYVNPLVIDSDRNSNPVIFSLNQNHPNPFNPSTTIEFTLPKSEFVELKVYNILGKEVATLVSNKLNQGNHSYQFDGQNLASGIYYYQLIAGDYREVKKMILLK